MIAIRQKLKQDLEFSNTKKVEILEFGQEHMKGVDKNEEG